jgi:hypothetical protein
MLLCLFCSSALTQTTKPEHVLLNCLGGRKTTTVVTCSSCNEALGSELDDELCDTVKEIRNYLALPKGDGSPAPMIRRDDPQHGRVVLMPGGLPVSRDVVFDIQRDGSNVELNVSVGTHEKLAELLPHIARRLRISEAQVRAVLRQSNLEQKELYLSPVPHGISFGTDRAQRAMAKMCLTLIASRLGVDRVRTFDIRRAVAYVVSGDNTADVSIGFQSNPLPISDALEHQFGPFFNALIVRVTSEGVLYGYFRLYNGPSWLFRCRPESGWNSRGAISGRMKLSDQAARSIG